MTSLATLLWASNLFCDVTGQLSFKAAAVSSTDAAGFERWRRMLANRWIWVGVGAFVAEFGLWLAFLSIVPLSLAVLVGSADIVAVMVGGKICFREAVTPRRAVAATLIAVGVALVGWT
jgi:drug/metabolite transporter (DMT)-like permease